MARTATHVLAERTARGAEAGGPETRRRLLDAAASAFAERGFRDASLREICRRAGANVAAVNYHFRSKDRLYAEVLRGAFARSSRDHPLPPWPAPPRDEAEARGRLKFVIRQVADGVLDPRPARHSMVIMREMLEPSRALDAVLDEFVRPRCKAIEDALAPFLPGASPRALALHAISVLGQIV